MSWASSVARHSRKRSRPAVDTFSASIRMEKVKSRKAFLFSMMSSWMSVFQPPQILVDRPLEYNVVVNGGPRWRSNLHCHVDRPFHLKLDRFGLNVHYAFFITAAVRTQLLISHL